MNSCPGDRTSTFPPVVLNIPIEIYTLSVQSLSLERSTVYLSSSSHVTLRVIGFASCPSSSFSHFFDTASCFAATVSTGSGFSYVAEPLCPVRVSTYVSDADVFVLRSPFLVIYFCISGSSSSYAEGSFLMSAMMSRVVWLGQQSNVTVYVTSSSSTPSLERSHLTAPFWNVAVGAPDHVSPSPPFAVVE